jgi:hypothetical protein
MNPSAPGASSVESPAPYIYILLVALLVSGLCQLAGCFGFAADYVQLQNLNRDGAIENLKWQLEQGRQADQDFNRLREALAQYVRQTKDVNLVRLLASYGVVLAQQMNPPGAPSPGAAQVRPAAPVPASSLPAGGVGANRR